MRLGAWWLRASSAWTSGSVAGEERLTRSTPARLSAVEGGCVPTSVIRPAPATPWLQEPLWSAVWWTGIGLINVYCPDGTGSVVNFPGSSQKYDIKSLERKCALTACKRSKPSLLKSLVPVS